MPNSLFGDDEGSRGEFLRLLAEQGEEPSFLRRAQETQAAWQGVLDRCRSHRDDLLRWPRMHLANLARQVDGDWSRLESLLEDGRRVSVFRAWSDDWSTRKSASKIAANVWSTVRGSLMELARSVERFNRLWSEYARNVDLAEVNQLRLDYNRFYPIEKSAAFDSGEIERLGFVPLAMATSDDLLAAFPLLELPALKR
jgi:hypothetical protein